MRSPKTGGMIDDYGLVCRRMSRILLAFSIIFIVILQIMTFYIAVDGGLNTFRAIAMSLVPILGPVSCGFQLVFAGAGSPLILLVLFIPSVITILGRAYFCDEYKNSLIGLENGNDNDIHELELLRLENQEVSNEENEPQLLPKINHEPKPEPLPKVESEPKPQSLPEITPNTKPQPLPIPKPQKKTIKVAETNSENINRKSEHAVSETGVKEYDKALNDVLSILNK